MVKQNIRINSINTKNQEIVGTAEAEVILPEIVEHRLDEKTVIKNANANFQTTKVT